MCQEWKDEQGDAASIRLQGAASDLHAADARYSLVTIYSYTLSLVFKT